MGFVVRDNYPVQGCIAWENVHIAYKGQTYAIQNGYTSYKYVWWDHRYPNQFVVGDELPQLTDDDCLVFLNKNGTHLTVPNTTIIDGSLIVPESILTNALAANCVTSEKIMAGAITADKIAANAVGAEAIAAGSILGDHIVAGAITGDKIAARTITANNIATNTITAASGVIADAAITTAKIADGAITTAKIGDLQVTNAKIANGAVDNAKIANLDASKITSGYISAARIAAGSITGDKIAASTITADKLNVSSLSAISANLGTVTAGTLQGVNVIGGTIKTADAANRLEMSGDSFKAYFNSVKRVEYSFDRINFYDGNGALAGYVSSEIGVLTLKNVGKRTQIEAQASSVDYAYVSIIAPYTGYPGAVEAYAINTNSNYGPTGTGKIILRPDFIRLETTNASGDIYLESANLQIYANTYINNRLFQVTGQVTINGALDVAGNVYVNNGGIRITANAPRVAFNRTSGSTDPHAGFSLWDGGTYLTGKELFYDYSKGYWKIGDGKIWHANNDGAGSGLDSDLFDGKDSSYFQPASDERLKTDIQPITAALEKVLALQGVSFVWNEKAEEIGAKRETLAGREIGLIAQQVAEVVPEVVLDWIETPDGETYKTVDTSRMVALLVEAIKELNTKIEAIEQQLEGGIVQ